MATCWVAWPVTRRKTGWATDACSSAQQGGAADSLRDTTGRTQGTGYSTGRDCFYLLQAISMSFASRERREGPLRDGRGRGAGVAIGGVWRDHHHHRHCCCCWREGPRLGRGRACECCCCCCCCCRAVQSCDEPPPLPPPLPFALKPNGLAAVSSYHRLGRRVPTVGPFPRAASRPAPASASASASAPVSVSASVSVSVPVASAPGRRWQAAAGAFFWRRPGRPCRGSGRRAHRGCCGCLGGPSPAEHCALSAAHWALRIERRAGGG